ncbi:LysR family transcriptional regulator [Caldichromatium japonicum]|uniref:HTH-type transcriptional regulator MetR n=1 Tax=Caldichromatium japonicum TaxID=2699430 RepID=A0A6G7VC21_9GAMM|nr:LysR family transcriptional regulator [Caldichromatium japonicum]QIK37425.1 LysR family transcriptional regulator [Caldichromatium japonicum]
MSIELRHLRLISTLSETGSLTQAGQRLHLTQSALSHQLKGLEDLVGQVLFERKTRPLRLTAAGERLLRLAEEVLPRVERAESDLRHLAVGQAGRLLIVLECHSCFDWLLPAMDAYRPAWPEVELDLGLSFAAIKRLVAGDADLVITSDPSEGEDLRFVPLFRFEILLAMSPDHPLACRPFISPQDLATETLLTYPVSPLRLDVMRAFLLPARVEPAAIRTAELSLMLIELVRSRRGVAALPSWVLVQAVASGKIAARPLGTHGLWSTLYASTRADPPAYVSAFIETAAQTASSILPDVVPCLERSP